MTTLTAAIDKLEVTFRELNPAAWLEDSASTKFLQSDWVTLFCKISQVEEMIWKLEGVRP
jgi:hypothetical protein